MGNIYSLYFLYTSENGNWGHWGQWTKCTAVKKCRRGRKSSRRICDNPPPLKGGANCTGLNQTVENCYSICPRRCTFDENTCEYTFDGRWTHRGQATPSFGTGPSDDSGGK